MAAFYKTSAVALAALLTCADAARLLGFENKKNIIPNSYIVSLKDDIPEQEFETHISWVNNVHSANVARSEGSTASTSGVKFTYKVNGWKGYSGSFDQNTLDELLADEKVSTRTSLESIAANIC